MSTPSEFVMQHTPWSLSKANTAQQCPHKFYLQYVKKVKTPYNVNYYTRVGKAVHKALEYALGGMAIGRAFQLAVAGAPLASGEADAVQNFIPAAQRFITGYRDYTARNACAKAQIEQKLSVDFNGNPVKFFDNDKGFFRGVIDVYSKFTTQPAAVVLDHKTGRIKDLSEYQTLFSAYALLLGAQCPELKVAYVGINHMADGTVALAPQPHNLENRECLMASIVSFLNDATVEAHDYDVTRKGPLCKMCEYQQSGHCPIYAGDVSHGENQEQTTTDKSIKY